MGIRFRKSINLGAGFRVNLSKSGVGYSWGVKGARLTKTAKGSKRTTVSIPGTGLSYVKETRANTAATQPLPQPFATNRKEPRNLNKVDAAQYQTAEYKDFLKAIKRVRFVNWLSTILICTLAGIAGQPLLLGLVVIGVVLKILTHTTMAVSVEYTFDESERQKYESLCKTWMSMNQNDKLWQITSDEAANRKIHAGATRSVDRINAKAICKAPYFLKTNLKPFGLKLRKKKLYFLPDKLLVIEGTKVGAISYDTMRLQFGTTKFVEEPKSVPKDALVVEYCWEKTNADGSMDRRFKGNRQLPVCQYGTVVIQAPDLYVNLMYSSIATIKQMETIVSEISGA